MRFDLPVLLALASAALAAPHQPTREHPKMDMNRFGMTGGPVQMSHACANATIPGSTITGHNSTRSNNTMEIDKAGMTRSSDMRMDMRMHMNMNHSDTMRMPMNKTAANTTLDMGQDQHQYHEHSRPGSENKMKMILSGISRRNTAMGIHVDRVHQSGMAGHTKTMGIQMEMNRQPVRRDNETTTTTNTTTAMKMKTEQPEERNQIAAAIRYAHTQAQCDMSVCADVVTGAACFADVVQGGNVAGIPFNTDTFSRCVRESDSRICACASCIPQLDTFLKGNNLC